MKSCKLNLFAIAAALQIAATTFACGQNLFTKISPVALDFNNTQNAYKGASWIDLDHDNLPDIFIAPRFFFKNDGGGNFSKLPELATGLVPAQLGSGHSLGDTDNDGDLDIITSNSVSNFYQNSGTAWLAKSAEFPELPASWDCALADANLDGRLDAIWAHAAYFHTADTMPCYFALQKTDGSGWLRQQGKNEFTDQLKPYTIPVWSDFDLDGDPDLFIGSGPAGSKGEDFCYRNLTKETGKFELQRLSAPPFDELQDGQVYNFPDFDNDGDLDIFLTNYGGATSRFWENKGNGLYQDLAAPFATKGQFLANVWGDLDNDGWLDVLTVRDGEQTARIFLNQKNGTFAAAGSVGTADNTVAAVALADFDNDGALDALTNGRTKGHAIFKNNSAANGNRWVSLTLEGTASNRSAIGAVVRAKAMIDGKPTWLLREVSAHNSFQCQNDLRVHFGLGTASVVDSVEVRWPSGQRERFAGLQVGKFYKVIEGQGIQQISAAGEVAGDFAVKISPNPFSEDLKIELPDALRDDTFNLQLFGADGRQISVSVVRQDSFLLLRPTSLGLPSGVYFLKILGEEGLFTIRKVVKN